MNIDTIAAVCAALLLLGTAVEACGPQSDEPKIDPTPRSVGVDELGCPLVDPTPWVLELDDYEVFCGDGCSPFSGRLEANQDSHWFVACVSDDIEGFPTNGNPDVCLRSTVDGGEYVLKLSRALFLTEMCWLPCFLTGPDDPGFEDLAIPYPEYCFN